MTSNLKYIKNYTELGETYQLVLPLCLEGLVPEDDSVRLLSHILEDLDYTRLYLAYSAKGRNPAVDPKTMFKNHQIPYIKLQTYEKWKKRSFKQDISKRENMKFEK